MAYKLRIFSRKSRKNEIIFESNISKEIALERFFKHPDDIPKNKPKICLADTPVSLAQFARAPVPLLKAIEREFNQEQREKLYNSCIDEKLNKANRETLEQIFLKIKPPTKSALKNKTQQEQLDHLRDWFLELLSYPIPEEEEKLCAECNEPLNGDTCPVCGDQETVQKEPEPQTFAKDPEPEIEVPKIEKPIKPSQDEDLSFLFGV